MSLCVWVGEGAFLPSVPSNEEELTLKRTAKLQRQRREKDRDREIKRERDKRAISFGFSFPLVSKPSFFKTLSLSLSLCENTHLH